MSDIHRLLEAEGVLPSYTLVFILVNSAMLKLAVKSAAEWHCGEVELLRCLYFAKQWACRSGQSALIDRIRQLLTFMRHRLETVDMC